MPLIELFSSEVFDELWPLSCIFYPNTIGECWKDCFCQGPIQNPYDCSTGIGYTSPNTLYLEIDDRESGKDLGNPIGDIVRLIQYLYDKLMLNNSVSNGRT